MDVRYHANVESVADLPAADLLVGADGANSLVRRAYAEAFRPSLDVRQNRYIWLGTRRLFSGLTLTFKESEAGVFAAHSYRFAPDTSTFIVEAVGDAWEHARFEGMAEAETRRFLERLFASELEGQPLLTNNFVKWLRFVIVKNERWRHGHVVLLGDALHTAHFSIGSGTKLALEDAIALASCFAGKATVDAALAEVRGHPQAGGGRVAGGGALEPDLVRGLRLPHGAVASRSGLRDHDPQRPHRPREAAAARSRLRRRLGGAAGPGPGACGLAATPKPRSASRWCASRPRRSG